MRIVLDLDDFANKHTCRNELVALNEHFSDFKISMFAVPFRTTIDTIEEFRTLGCEFLPHGFLHSHLEMDTMPYELVAALLNPVSDLVSLGYYGRVFKAPYWRYSQGSYQALIERGFTIATSREQVNPPPAGTAVYEYDLELDEPWRESELDVVRLHGHVTPYRNSIDRWYRDLIDNLPADTEFMWVSEYVDHLREAGG